MVASAAAFLAIQGPGVIVDLAQRILRENGLPEVDFTVSNVTLKTVTLKGIRIGRENAVRIPRISAVFTWRELIDGEVGEISVDGLEITVRQRDHGLSFGELDPFVYGAAVAPEDETPIGSLNWPFRKLALSKARVTLLDPQDRLVVAMTIDGTVNRAHGGGLDIGPARISATSPEVNLTAAIQAVVSGDGRLSATMALERGTAAFQGYDIVATDGSLSLDTPLDNLSALEATGQLRVSEVGLPLGFATSGQLDLTISTGRLKAILQAEDAHRGLTGTLSIATSLADPLAAQPVDIELTLAAEDAGRLPENVLPLPLTNGAASIRIALADTVGTLQSLAGFDSILALARAFPALSVDLKGMGISTPILPGAVDINATLRLAQAEDGAIAVLAPDTIRASLTPTDPSYWQTLLGPLAQSSDVQPIHMTLNPPAGSPLMVFQPGEILQKARFDGSFRLEGAALPTLDGALSAGVIVDPHAGIFDANVEQLALAIERAVLDDYTVTDFILNLTAKATESGISGSTDLTASLVGGSLESILVPGAKIAIPATWSVSADSFSLVLRDCAAVIAPKLRTARAEMDLRGVRFCLQQGGDSFLTISFDGADGPVSGTLDAVLTSQGRDMVVLLPDGRRVRLGGKGNSITLRGDFSRNRAIAFDAKLALGRISLPASLIQIGDLAFSAKARNLDEKVTAKMSARVSDLAKPFRFAPLDLSFDAAASKRDALTATGTVAFDGAPLKMEWEFDHVLSTRKGRATARIPPFEFGFGVNQLSDLTSLLNGVVSRPSGHLLGAASGSWVDGGGCGNGDILVRQAGAVLPGTGSIPVPGELSVGQIGVTAKLCTDGKSLTSQAGQLLLDGLGFAGDQISVEAVNANVDIASFHPFATAPDQVLAVGVIDMGFPLTDGLATFQVTDSSTFALKNLAFNWAGGTVSVAPFEISPNAPLSAVDLTVKGAQLQNLTDLIPDKGVSGEGILDGKLPIRLTTGGPAVENGYLEARGPGVLRYIRSLGEGEVATAVDDVLSNLQYSKLRMDIDGGLNGGVAIGLSVEGKNPKYLDGYPIVLDVNVNGPLGAIMNDGLATYKVPSQILERMRRFGQLQ